MKPYELRLAQEHAKAAHHLKNLQAFIDDQSRFPRIDKESQLLMKQQVDILAAYVAVLARRLAIFNIPV